MWELQSIADGAKAKNDNGDRVDWPGGRAIVPTVEFVTDDPAVPPCECL